MAVLKCSHVHTQLSNLHFLFLFHESVLQYHQTRQWRALRAQLLLFFFSAPEQSEVLRQYVCPLSSASLDHNRSRPLSASAQVFLRGFSTLHMATRFVPLCRTSGGTHTICEVAPTRMLIVRYQPLPASILLFFICVYSESQNHDLSRQKRK